MTTALFMHTPTLMANQTNNETKPEFSGGTTLRQQKNTSLEMVFKSGENIRDAGVMQATSMILAGVGSLVGAGLAVGFTAYGSKALKQTQTEMKSVNNKLSIVDNNIQRLDVATKDLKPLIEKNKPNTSTDRFDPMKSKLNSEQLQGKYSADRPKVVSEREMKKTVEDLDKTKLDKAWNEIDEPNIGLIQRGSSSFKKLDRSLHSEKKNLNKRMEALSGEHNAELNKATQRGQLSNSAVQGMGQTSSGIPHVAKGEYDSQAQANKSVGEQIEGSARQSEEARNQTLQSANHINQILDQLKAAEKA